MKRREKGTKRPLLHLNRAEFYLNREALYPTTSGETCQSLAIYMNRPEKQTKSAEIYLNQRAIHTK
ncbi:MAG: hypothetical protein ABI787_07815 [Spartobacteria bacterium]